MKISSPVFKNGETIPKKYGYKNGNISPPLTFEDIPKDAESLVLIMDDPDAKAVVGKEWVHWLVWNIPVETKEFLENFVPNNIPQGKTDFNEIGYGGPAPPDKEHTYIFKLYAISKFLDLDTGAKKIDIEKMISNHIISESRLEGKYSPQ